MRARSSLALVTVISLPDKMDLPSDEVPDEKKLEGSFDIFIDGVIDGGAPTKAAPGIRYGSVV